MARRQRGAAGQALPLGAYTRGPAAPQGLGQPCWRLVGTRCAGGELQVLQGCLGC